MSRLADQLEVARAEVARLEREAAQATCIELGGCDMVSSGGANCGCPDGQCSIPVCECTRCGDCDYGDNDEAREQRSSCAASREIPDDVYFSVASDNFYSVPIPGGDASEGQGSEFFRYWKQRWREFPVCDCQMVPTHISMDCPIHG